MYHPKLFLSFLISGPTNRNVLFYPYYVIFYESAASSIFQLLAEDKEANHGISECSEKRLILI